MKPFRSADEMLQAHELMCGPAGRQCAEIVLRWAERLFAVPLDVLNIRVVLAPVEIGPYNRSTGYCYGKGLGAFILGNRHIAEFWGGTIVLKPLDRVEDFLIHELTHMRQAQVLREHPEWKSKRGAHRDRGWYTAISEACPRYLGFQCPPSSWPTGPRTRAGTLTEVDMTHWPGSLRKLARTGDPRLPAIVDAA
jgi:hypothetical protein